MRKKEIQGSLTGRHSPNMANQTNANKFTNSAGNPTTGDPLASPESIRLFVRCVMCSWLGTIKELVAAGRHCPACGQREFLELEKR